MSWLSKLWHQATDLPGDNKAQQQAQGATATAISQQNATLISATQSAQQAAALALKAQQDANTLAAANSAPQRDNEGARAASDDEQRKLLAGSSFSIGLPTKFGQPPVGYRLLAGQ